MYSESDEHKKAVTPHSYQCGGGLLRNVGLMPGADSRREPGRPRPHPPVSMTPCNMPHRPGPRSAMTCRNWRSPVARMRGSPGRETGALAMARDWTAYTELTLRRRRNARRGYLTRIQRNREKRNHGAQAHFEVKLVSEFTLFIRVG